MTKIDAVAMVREIRDKQNKDTFGKSPQEIIEYFRKKASEISKNPGDAKLDAR